MPHNDPDHVQRQSEREADSFTGGPGVAATKSQMKGSMAGAAVGAIVGALIGVVVGAIFFEGTLGMIISAVSVGLAGATAGGVSGGFVGPRRKLDGGEADT